MSGSRSCIFICLLLMTVRGSASAEDSDKPDTRQPGAVLEVSPSSVELVPGGRFAESLLILRNPSAASLVDIKITTFADADVDRKIEPAEVQSVIPKGELAWQLTVSTKSGGPTNGTLFFRVDYVQKAGTDRIPKVAYTKLSFTSRDIAEIAEVKIETTLDSLDEHHPGKVYLVVTNKSSQAISLRDFAPEGPAFIRFSKAWFDDKKQKGELGFLPHQTRSIPADVEANGRVQPGKHLLVFTVEFEWDQKGVVQKRSAVVTQPVEVGVLGESAALKLLGVPSFLFIPGVLAVATWGLLWNWGVLRSKKDTTKFPFSFDQPITNLQFWVVAITVSVLIVMGYSLLNPGILRIYNLEDLVRLWLASVFGVGVMGYLAIIGWREICRRMRTPSVTDTPLKLLEKLGRQKLSTFRERVNTKLRPDEGPRRAFLLQERSTERVTSWVGPAVSLAWQPNLPPEIQSVKDEVTKQRWRAGDPGQAAKDLKKAGQAVAIQWKQPEEGSTEIVGLHEVPTSELEYLDADSIIQDQG